jgi:phosphate-selective porin
MIRVISIDIGFWERCPQFVLRLLVVPVTVVLLTSPAAAQSKTGQQAQSGVTWDEGSIRFGDSVRIDPKVRVQGDVLLWNDQGPIEDRFSWGSRRIGVDGELFDRVQFQVERAFQDDDDDDTPWRDVFVDVRLNRAFQVRGGRFKLPFSLERNTSRDQLDFIQRATAVRALSPARDTGVMVHGRVANRVVEYEAGIFQHADGLDLVDDPNSWSSLGATLAGRVLVSPIRDRDDGPTRDLHFGVALVRNTVPEGLNGVVGRLFDNDRFSERMNVNGQRTRLGAEGLWRGTRVTVKGELLQLTDQRLQQSVTGEDLSDLVLRGAYVTGIVRVFGERGRNGQAIDVAARLDRLTLGSGNDTDEAFTNPRADRVAPLAKNTWTFGGNWQVHRWVRVQGNLIREVLVDSLDVRDINTEPMWTAIVRFQFAL